MATVIATFRVQVRHGILVVQGVLMIASVPLVRVERPGASVTEDRENQKRGDDTSKHGKNEQIRYKERAHKEAYHESHFARIRAHR